MMSPISIAGSEGEIGARATAFVMKKEKALAQTLAL